MLLPCISTGRLASKYTSIRICAARSVYKCSRSRMPRMSTMRFLDLSEKVAPLNHGKCFNIKGTLQRDRVPWMGYRIFI